jgi:outer membrane protein assembly factor BamB
MPSKAKFNPMEFLYVGIRGHVVALRKRDGSIAWEADLPRGSSFVPIVQDGHRLYAASGGEVSCLDCATGKRLWHNGLRGYGTGFVALAGGGFPTSAASLEQAAQVAATSAAITAASA